MKYILFIFIIAFTDYVFGQGDAPALLQGQYQGSKSVGSFIQTPNSGVTKINSSTALIETGNNNILVNPSFEHQVFSTGWTVGSGTFTEEIVNEIHGKKAAKLVLSSQTMVLTQDSSLYAAQFADGVQGLAYARVKTSLSGIKVCSRNAGTTSTTLCVDVNSDNKWGLYKVPFILGATSNGISVASAGALTGNVYVDDAFVGAVDLKQDINNVGPWRNGTCTATLTTNTTTTCKYRQVGEDLEVQYASTFSGAPNVADLEYSPPTGFTIDATKMNGPNTAFQAWPANGSLTDNGVATYYISAYLDSTNNRIKPYRLTTGTLPNITFQNPVSSSAPVAFGNLDSISLTVKFPVTQLSGSSSVYTASCGASCEDNFTAAVGATDVVSGENVDWINGDCTNAGTGLQTCNFNSGIFTQTPVCTVSAGPIGGSFQYANIYSVSSSAITIEIRRTDSSIPISNNSTLSCTKAGADFIATRNIVGSFNEVMTTPGISKPKTCYYAFGGASATLASPTMCASGTCTEVVDTCGNATPPTFAVTGVYTNFTLANGTFANSSFVDCRCTAWDASTGNARECIPYWETGDQSWQTTSSGGYVTNLFTSNAAGTASNTYVQIKCEGQAP